MGRQDLFHDTQSQSGAAAFSRTIRIYSVKALENALQMVFRYTFSCIHDLNPDFIQVPAITASDSAFIGICDRVIGEVDQNLTDTCPVRAHVNNGVLDNQIDPLFVGFCLFDIVDLIQELGQLKYGRFDEVLAIFQSRNLNQVREQVVEPFEVGKALFGVEFSFFSVKTVQAKASKYPPTAKIGFLTSWETFPMNSF